MAPPVLNGVVDRGRLVDRRDGDAPPDDEKAKPAGKDEERRHSPPGEVHAVGAGELAVLFELRVHDCRVLDDRAVAGVVPGETVRLGFEVDQLSAEVL